MPQDADLKLLSGAMSRAAFETLKRWTGAGEGLRKDRRAAIRELPLLIRRHGLRRTLHHWLAEAKDDKQHITVASAFAAALARVAPGLPSVVAPAPNGVHMLQTRLALDLADQWLAISEAMLKEPGGGASGEPAWAGGAPAAPTPLPPVAANERNGAFEFFNTPYPGNGVPRPNAGSSLTINSELTAWHFDRVCQTHVAADSPYGVAYKRWNALCQVPGTKSKELAFTHRVLIGLSEPSLWETAISIDPVYGVPTIAGSAVKGLATHFARGHLCGEGGHMTEPLCETLFGTAGCAGVVEFLDAWWVPGSSPTPGPTNTEAASCPFVREVVTPHHQEFLDRESSHMATPFDKPVPVPQLAAHGKFLFAVHGPDLWAEHALDILQLALEMAGVGARTPEYGQAFAPPTGVHA